MTVPLGFLAEKYGHVSILRLNLIPRLFMLSWALLIGYLDESLPPQAAIAGAALSCLGGDTLFNSLVYALAAKITDDSVTRATYFSWMTGLSSVINFAGPAVASATMTLQLLLPFWLGIIFILLAIPAISLLPQASLATSRMEDEQQRPLISSPTLKARASETSRLTPIFERVRVLVSIVKTHPRNLSLLLVSFFLTAWASSDTKLLAQFISKRYQWTFQSAGYLLSVKATVNFIILILIVPYLLRIKKSSRRANPQSLSDRENSRYAKLCLIMSVFGALMIGFSSEIWMLFPSLVTYAIGVPLSIFTLGLLKSPEVSPRDNGITATSADAETHIFAIVMMTKTLGSLVGAPFMATLWVTGIRLGIYGLPFFASTLIYLAAMVVFSGIRFGTGTVV
ncbi:MFS general substrate transporter [Xylariaceae sp. FL0016]|nr:MFS general substrate transporter [Xylariaceae sp. FL0016]